MALKDEIVKLLEKKGQLSSGDIQAELGVGYPISKSLGELADDKRIHKVSRGMYGPRKAAAPTNGKPHTNGTSKGLVGEIRRQAVLTTDQDDVVLKVDGNEFRIKWPKFVDVFVSNCDPS